MVALSNISWGSYGGFEGPAYFGKKFYTPSQEPSFNEKCFAVVASAEGACDSINMYDRAVISVGAIQWTELTDNKVSELIGYVAENVEGGEQLVLDNLAPALTMSGAEFKLNAQGKFRFFVSGVEVKGETLARQMFCGGSGRVGSWTNDTKLRAKTWCMCIANLFQNEEACKAQAVFTAPQLRKRFVWKNGEKLLFGPDSPEDGMGGAVKALLVGYAINLPAVADKVIASAVAASKYPKWSNEWCLDVMYGLAMTSGVSIWPGRYDAKRVPLEKFFGVTLPKNSSELAKRAWQKHAPQVKPAAPPVVSHPVQQPTPEPQPVPLQALPEPPVAVQPIEQQPSKQEQPAAEIVLIRPDGIPVKHESPFMAVLQWFPMLFGAIGQFVSWLVHLIRGQ